MSTVGYLTLDIVHLHLVDREEVKIMNELINQGQVWQLGSSTGWTPAFLISKMAWSRYVLSKVTFGDQSQMILSSPSEHAGNDEFHTLSDAITAARHYGWQG